MAEETGNSQIAPQAAAFDLYKPDRKTIDTQKVLFTIWKFRFNGPLFADIIELTMQFLSEKRVLNEMEFYLPQWSHIMINLCGPSNVVAAGTMESLLIRLCQISPPVAYQLYLSILAAVEDYRPELSTGLVNTAANSIKHTHCCRLLNLIMQSVVFGNPALTSTEEAKLAVHLQEDGLGALYDAERAQRLDEIMESASRTNEYAESTMSLEYSTPSELVSGTLLSSSLAIFNRSSKRGVLLYKRCCRKSAFATKPWKERLFCVTDRVLYCFRLSPVLDGSQKPLRSVLLHMAEVCDLVPSKHPYTLSVRNPMTNSRFLLRATNERVFEEWRSFLLWEANRPPERTLAIPPSEVIDQSSGISLKKLLDLNSSVGLLPWNRVLTAGRLKRFRHFEQNIRFTFALTEICDLMCSVALDQRKETLRRMLTQLSLPPFYYLPTATSLTSCSTVVSIPVNECKSFQTKARCPCLIVFEVEMHPAKIDITTFLNAELQEYDESDVVALPSVLRSFSSDAIGQSMVPPVAAAGSVNDPMTNSTASDAQPVTPAGLRAGSKFVHRVPDAVAVHRVGWKREGNGIRVVSEVLGRPGLRKFASSSSSNAFGASPPPLGRSVSIRIPGDAQGGAGQGSLSLDTRQASSSSLSAPSPARPPDSPMNGSAADFSYDSDSKAGASMGTGGGIAAAAPTSAPASVSTKLNPERSVAFEEVAVMTGFESFRGKSNRLRSQSPFGHLPGWKLEAVIVKSRDDLRQEAFIMQLLQYFQLSFRRANVPVWLQVYRISACSNSTGFVQYLPNTISLDSLKKHASYAGSLRLHFEQTFGPPDQERFAMAVSEFMRSLAAYSIVTYLLAIKDRHNGNIMLDSRGHIIHIDFGFVLGIAPGNQFSIESAPFKLTAEYVEVMGGVNSATFQEFKALCHAAFLVARKHAPIVVGLLEIMSFDSNLPAFQVNPHVVTDFRARLYSEVPDDKIGPIVESLIQQSLHSYGTGLYDQYQYATNGYAI